MKKSKEKKIDKKINTIYTYIQAFNSPLAPRGNGARFAAGQEYHEHVVSLFDTFNTAVMNNDLETVNYVGCMMIEIIERAGLDLIDMEPEVYYAMDGDDYEDD